MSVSPFCLSPVYIFVPYHRLVPFVHILANIFPPTASIPFPLSVLLLTFTIEFYCSPLHSSPSLYTFCLMLLSYQTPLELSVFVARVSFKSFLAVTIPFVLNPYPLFSVRSFTHRYGHQQSRWTGIITTGRCGRSSSELKTTINIPYSSYPCSCKYGSIHLFIRAINVIAASHFPPSV